MTRAPGRWPDQVKGQLFSFRFQPPCPLELAGHFYTRRDLCLHGTRQAPGDLGNDSAEELLYVESIICSM